MDSIGSSSSDRSDDSPRTSDVVIGIASYNNAATIGAVARAATIGLGLSQSAGCIIVADGGSTDGTVDRARQAIDGAVPVISAEYRRPHIDPLRAPYHGLPGRPAAIRTVLLAARERHAKACAFLDASLTSVTPDWVPSLVDPIHSEIDYVSPYYVRHVHEGAITKSIVSPLFRALYGLRLRQPAAGEFGCSSQFLRHVLDQRFWDAEEAKTGIDLWLASTAATGTFKMSEVVLGVRTYEARPDAPDLSTTLTQVASAVFADMEARVDTWQRVRGSRPVPRSGDVHIPQGRSAGIDIEAMRGAFNLGYTGLREVWASVVPPRTVLEIKKLAETPTSSFRFGDDLWAEIVYDFALAYRSRSIPREHLLGALTPLYLGWLAAFLLKVGDADVVQEENRLEQLCLAFEAKKSYLISGWRWPERFRA